MNIKLTFLFLIIFFSFGASSEATAQVQFSGVTTSDMANLKKKFPELKIEAPELATLDEIIRYLALTETYSAIRLIEKDKGYTLQAVPLKRIAEINITGNEHFSNDEILAALKMKIGSRFDSAKVIEAGEDLKELYAREGYFNTIVSFNFED
ncbi:MAG: FtsQ-type POTRA domain-containing protein, partial [Bdellovibrionales bacterium]|nr:FtsQ-type POTRA domain-containing protein [Bdellovibrionales bacterium]